MNSIRSVLLSSSNESFIKNTYLYILGESEYTFIRNGVMFLLETTQTNCEVVYNANKSTNS